MFLRYYDIDIARFCEDTGTKKRRTAEGGEIKMRKKIWLCALLMLILLFTACTEPDVPDVTATPEPKVFIPLTDAEGKLLYTVVRGEYWTDGEKSAALLLCQIAKQATGQTVAIESDWVSRDTEVVENDKYEILVGNTNRAESIAAAEELGSQQYLVRTYPETHKIVLLGADDTHTRMAVEAFMTDYLGYSEQTGEASPPAALTIPENLHRLETAVYLPLDKTSQATLVDTVYPTADAVVADIVLTKENYAVDPTGKKGFFRNFGV